MSPDEPVTVYKAWNPRQAHLVCQVLANADIEARVASDALEMALGDVPFQQATSPVLVHAADAERARAVLAEFDARLADRSGEPRDGAAPSAITAEKPSPPANRPVRTAAASWIGLGEPGFKRYGFCAT